MSPRRPGAAIIVCIFIKNSELFQILVYNYRSSLSGGRRAYFNTAACLRALGYPKKCLEALEIVVKLAPMDNDCRHWREKITRQLSERGQWDQMLCPVTRWQECTVVTPRGDNHRMIVCKSGLVVCLHVFLQTYFLQTDITKSSVADSIYRYIQPYSAAYIYRPSPVNSGHPPQVQPKAAKSCKRSCTLTTPSLLPSDCRLSASPQVAVSSIHASHEASHDCAPVPDSVRVPDGSSMTQLMQVLEPERQSEHGSQCPWSQSAPGTQLVLRRS